MRVQIGLLLVLLSLSMVSAHVCNDVVSGGQVGCPDPQTVRYISHSSSDNRFTIVSDVTAKHIQWLQAGGPCKCTDKGQEGCYDNNDYGNCNAGACFTSGFSLTEFTFTVTKGNREDLTFSSSPALPRTLSDRETARFNIYIDVASDAPTQEFQINVGMEGTLSSTIRPIYTLSFNWESESSGCSSDSECLSPTPYCNIATHACVACVNAGQCNDNNECTSDSCSSNVCQHSNVADASACTAGHCCGGVCDTTTDNENYHADCRSGPSCSGTSYRYGSANNGNLCAGSACRECNNGLCNSDDATRCTDTTCAEPVCNSGACSGSNVAAGSTDEACYDNIGCTGGSCRCDGTGQCASSITCTDECSPSGSKRCSLNNAETCTNYDSDSCLEWGGSQACPDTTCREPACASGVCSETLVSLNQTDEGCSGSTGCTGGNCRCNGAGTCLCTASCSSLGYVCGNFTICGTTVNCGHCSGTCTNGVCSTCTPDCSGKECGSDGCGGSCGACESYYEDGTCFDSGTCEGSICIYESHTPTNAGCCDMEFELQSGSCKQENITNDDYCEFPEICRDCACRSGCDGDTEGECVDGCEYCSLNSNCQEVVECDKEGCLDGTSYCTDDCGITECSQGKVCDCSNGCRCVAACAPSWQCSAWGSCDGNKRTRSCDDTNGCSEDKIEEEPCNSALSNEDLESGTANDQEDQESVKEEEAERDTVRISGKKPVSFSWLLLMIIAAAVIGLALFFLKKKASGSPLQKFVKVARENNYTDEQIKSNLKQQGIDDSKIEEAFKR